MLWQPHALPRAIGLTDRHRGAARSLRPSITPLTVGRMAHLGGATGSVFIEARLVQTPTATLYAVKSHAYSGRHVLKCVDLRAASRDDVAREVWLQRQAQGPYVIDVQQATYLPAVACFLLERGHGGSVEDVLTQALADGAPICVATVVGWLFDVAQALQQCHVRGIVHRDVKPDNMVLTRNAPGPKMRAKLTDFGLATTFTDPPHAVGTITYMAPEVLRNQGATQAADLWSLGTTLYRMLVGIEPYYDDSAEAIALRLLRHDPQFTLSDLQAVLTGRNTPKSQAALLVHITQGLLDPDATTRMTLPTLLGHLQALAPR